MLELAKNRWPSGANVRLSFRYAREGHHLFAAKPLRAGGHIGWGFEPQLRSETKRAALEGRRKGTFPVPLQGTDIMRTVSWD